MDILYVTKQGCSKCHDMELRWSLRSLEKYGKNVDKVFVVGWCPDWLSDKVIKIPYETNINTSDQNDIRSKSFDIADKVIYVADNADISDEFLVSMDDHFLVDTVDFNNWPFYAKHLKNNEDLPVEKNGIIYHDFLCDCREFLKENDLPTIHFAPHRNLHVSKTSLNCCKSLIQKAKENGKSIELFILLNNYRLKNKEITPTFIKDIKIHGGGQWWMTSSEVTNTFSTVDFYSYNGLYILMNGKYPTKSKYEI